MPAPKADTLPVMKGYGLLIAKARDEAGLDVGQLAERIQQSPSTVRRLEAEETEPSVEQVNALVAALPLSAEQLLKAMGVALVPPQAARLPREWITLGLDLTDGQRAAVLELMRQFLASESARR